MSIRRLFTGALAATLCAMLLAACGGSSAPAGPSALDPANKVPASVVAYASFAIRPEGSLKQNLTSMIDKLAGPKAAAELSRAFVQGADSSQKGIWSQIKPWLGQRVGAALIDIPSGHITTAALENELVVIAPTSNPAAARKYFATHHNLSTWAAKPRVVGNYVIGGGTAGIAAATATTTADSLAHSAAYISDTSRMPGNQFAIVYAKEHAVLGGALALLPKVSVATGSLISPTQLTASLARIPSAATIALAVTTSAHTFSLDMVSNGQPLSATDTTSAPSDVSGLPGDSWLALSIGGRLADPTTVAKLNSEVAALLAHPNGKLGLATTLRSLGKPLQFVVRDLLPALGPMSLSVAGSSLATLQAEVEITPTVASTRARLVRGVRGLLNGSLLPIRVGSSGSHVVVSWGFKTLAELLSPSSTLGDNPTFKQALAQLPSGSHAPLFLNFGPIAAFSSLDHSKSDAAVWKVVAKLNYLIAGGTPSDERLVLAVK